MSPSKVAVVLFNLGGPDQPQSVRPFLINLFTDPAILRVPFFIRPLLARIIAYARTPVATANYAILGGSSPLLSLTQRQADALQAALPEIEARCFIAMRYWHPFSEEAVRAVMAWDPDEVVLLPLYPHYSTTTTGSSLTAWREAASRAGLAKPTTSLCCWFEDDSAIAAATEILRKSYQAARASLAAETRLRVLFSAHGLPEVIVAAGDPYQWQIEQTAARIAAALAVENLDWKVCYQSRATPQKWLAPSTEDALEEAARDGVAVLVVPIAFVSEHSETLVELDVEYAELAKSLGIPAYFRAPAQNDDAGFIAALAGLVRTSRQHGPGLCSFAGGRLCPGTHRECPFARSAPPVESPSLAAPAMATAA